MSRFSGLLGFVRTELSDGGIYNEVSTEIKAKGTFRKISSRVYSEQEVNASVRLANEISVIGNNEIFNHLNSLKYVVWKGTKWSVTTITLEPPRVIIVLGGVYNGNV
jgi:hypothetical protein